ncbi:MAG TPA: biopolymer transporter ExbD [bacterium]|nr:biopolymer transporter ExbD [bacterium]HQI48452.1 biopolymer transporter ExbD [bacterium]HQJ63892.1 biopolymer transporter ExbD [bacterium]
MQHKKGRSNIRIDMTPMVDIMMLLLTFFMLTTRFKPPAEAEVVLPSSHSQFKLPESDVMTITVTKDDRYFLGLDSQRLRGRLFGEENALRSGIQLQDKQQLADLLIQARIANPKLRTVIKADKETPYGPIEDVMNILQKVKITRFNLVTELEKI